jgi:hypothetical protein
MLFSLPLAGYVIYHVHDTSYQDEKTIFVDDVKKQTPEESVEKDSAADEKGSLAA